MQTFDRWLTIGASKRAALRRWFDALSDAGELVRVEVDGEPAYARTADAQEIADTEPNSQVRLLPAFDQYVLGPGTNNARIIAAGRRAEISKASGWIAPVVLVGGRVAGTWTAAGSALTVVLFAETPKVTMSAIEAEAVRIGAFLGTSLTVRIQAG